jgi:hypothetical protein
MSNTEQGMSNDEVGQISFDIRYSVSLQNARILCFARGSRASLGSGPCVAGQLSARGVAHSVKHISRGEQLNQQFPNPGIWEALAGKPVARWKDVPWREC